MNKHTGSNFNDWLDDEGINQEVTTMAVKRVKAELERLANMPDSEIDYSDIPQLTPQQIANFRPAKEVFKFLDSEHYRPTKEQVTVRLDSDILAWLKQDGRGYQTRLNNLLRQMMITSHV